MKKFLLILLPILSIHTNASFEECKKMMIDLTKKDVTKYRLLENLSSTGRFISTSAESVYMGILDEMKYAREGEYECEITKNTNFNKYFNMTFRPKHPSYSPKNYAFRAQDFQAGKPGKRIWFVDFSIEFAN